jgi:hypothetical protein
MVGILVAEAAARCRAEPGHYVTPECGDLAHRHNAGERMSPGDCFAGLLTGPSLHAAANG